ncbi:hypothetical protein [Tepidibacter sp. Z1-5]|uniref:hypothetical protein n=1 Tax=Tepidibacter sp. Z1-5 TaxID=3134138 RepID=UPI0030BB297F
MVDISKRECKDYFITLKGHKRITLEEMIKQVNLFIKRLKKAGGEKIAGHIT